jgi:Phage T4 tail fibre
MKSLSLFASLLFTGFSFAQIYTPNGTVTGATTNATTNNIGIGITAPLEKLDVVGNIKTTGAFKFSLGGTITADATWIKFDKAMLAANILRTDNHLQVGANGAKFLVNYTTGNVGIGITAPLEKLDVVGNIKTNGSFKFALGGTITADATWIKFDKAILASNIIRTDNQLQVGANGITFLVNPTTGNVGIGTTTPGSSLVVAKGTDAMSFHSANGGSGIGFNRNVLDGTIFNTTKSAWQLSSGDEMFALEGYNGVASNLFIVLKNGNVGIGSATPNSKLELKNSNNTGMSILGNDKNYTGGDLAIARINTEETAGNGAMIQLQDVEKNAHQMIQGSKGGLQFFNFNSETPVWTERLRIANNGNVGIGTTTPDEKLTVKGKIHTNEVRVDVLAPIVPDYVFEADYKLKNLSEVAAFIQENKHLPEVPSAKEMEQNGLMLAEMNLKLLKKIEELTLYAIEQNKQLVNQNEQIVNQNNQLVSQNEKIINQNKEIATLQERLTKIEAKLK